jgi:hypothetical protein
MQIGAGMQFKKSQAALGMLLLTLVFGNSFNKPVYAEAPPPDQTDTDSGGGGSIDNGAGNGGSGDPGTNQSGQVGRTPSCYVVSPPKWFPVGPPLEEFDSVDPSLPYDLVSHTIIYDSARRFVYSYQSRSDDPFAPIPGGYEVWSDTMTGASFDCID